MPAAVPVPVPPPAIVCDAVWRDGPRGRDIAVRLRLPAGTTPVPVVVWSPGLGGGTGGGAAWGTAWAA
ncbi:hypothetical protein IP88_12215, partial [alpha proteobacterium AAP81b]